MHTLNKQLMTENAEVPDSLEVKDTRITQAALFTTIVHDENTHTY